MIVAIGGGGFIPARILRTELRVPILAVSLELYCTGMVNNHVIKKQWLGDQCSNWVRGKRILIVDEVDDTRTTLQYCVEEFIHNHNPSAIAVCVVHNKIKPKKGRLDRVLAVHQSTYQSEDVNKESLGDNLSESESTLYFPVSYFAGKDVEDAWFCYPWDAAAYGNDIDRHEELSKRS